MSLEDIRKEIDAIDQELVPLLKKRMDCSRRIAEIKRQEGLAVRHPAREEEILSRVREAGGEFGGYIETIYRELMNISREAQHAALCGEGHLADLIRNAKDEIKGGVAVACQGIEGAFSNIAAKQLHKEGEIRFFETFEEVFEAVESGEAYYGVVPVENSTAGSVGEVYDLILKYRFYIVAAAELRLNENLLGIKGARLEDIKTVYSHRQALKQTAEFLRGYGITPVEYSNTATAAKFVAEKNDKAIGAVGSQLAAELYGLHIIAPEIQTVPHNSTRFITISKELIIPKDANKVSVVFSLPHTVGSLQRVLNRFGLNRFNLTKIESRAARRGGFEYIFYLDFSGNLEDYSTVALISSLEEELSDFTFLGNYREEIIKE